MYVPAWRASAGGLTSSGRKKKKVAGLVDPVFWAYTTKLVRVPPRFYFIFFAALPPAHAARFVVVMASSSKSHQRTGEQAWAKIGKVVSGVYGTWRDWGTLVRDCTKGRRTPPRRLFTLLGCMLSLCLRSGATGDQEHRTSSSLSTSRACTLGCCESKLLHRLPKLCSSLAAFFASHAQQPAAGGVEGRN